MIRVKTFVLSNSGNTQHHERLDNYINNFLAENEVEVIDIKYSTAVASFDSTGKYFWVPSAMLIYKEKE